MSIGIGYDTHRFVENRKLIIGGVEIKNNFGLLGHSDADVLTHAIIDSILGAIAEGDIGKNFPDSDYKFKNISSLKLLDFTNRILIEKKFRINNIDSVVILDKPKISSYIDSMKKNISSVLKININALNIKATTQEGLGFIGKNLGASAQAICCVSRS
ncbi:MAG: 2-C-methyl-D-erythritol 2,4-cyclodiphosphate synthase [Clostridiales bacterium]|nr:2-C-methyl-D-erythritol 2,4-cyclodiphosphate synthase [Clostridiales bacterium]